MGATASSLERREEGSRSSEGGDKHEWLRIRLGLAMGPGWTRTAPTPIPNFLTRPRPRVRMQVQSRTHPRPHRGPVTQLEPRAMERSIGYQSARRRRVAVEGDGARHRDGDTRPRGGSIGRRREGGEETDGVRAAGGADSARRRDD